MSSKTYVAIAMVLAGATLFIAFNHRGPVTESVEPAPAQSLPGGALMLEKETPPAKPPVPIKARSRVARHIESVVKPAGKDCAPVKVTTQIVQEGDTLRTVTRAEGGEVVGGRDVVVRPLSLGASDDRKWAVGISCPASRDCTKDVGLVVQRDLGRIRVGIDASKSGTRAQITWKF